MPASDDEVIRLFHGLDPEDLPLGVYLVRPDGRFIIASRAVRRLLQLPESGPLGEASLARCYADPRERAAWLEKVNRTTRERGNLEGMVFRFISAGVEIYAEDFCRPLIHPQTGEILGYYGFLIDHTAEFAIRKQEQALKDRIEELTIDIGRVLHANTTTLLMVNHTLGPTLELLSLEQGLAANAIDAMAEQEPQHLDREAQKLIRALTRLFETTSGEQREKSLHQLRWEYLEQALADLKDYQAASGLPEAYPSFLRKLSHEIARVIQEVRPGHLPRETLREVQRAALDLQRIATLVTVHRTYQAVVQMDHTIRALREFITSDIRSDETYLPRPLAGILDQVIAQMSEFTKSRSVEIVKKDACPNVRILARERELARAFSNVLHNAIKYSWSRSHQRSPWVTIETHCIGDRVEVKFENWGVPIARDEIETGSIFHLGYRGRLSKDRNRLGTGIGLTDALRVVKQHHGELTVQSRPASSTQPDEGSRDYYDHPFLTTVTFSIPMIHGR